MYKKKIINHAGGQIPKEKKQAARQKTSGTLSPHGPVRMQGNQLPPPKNNLKHGM